MSGTVLLRKSLVILGTSILLHLHAGPGGNGSVITAENALSCLTQGNLRYVHNACNHPHQDQVQRIETGTHGQHPFVSILGCADSRVPLEVIFDMGIGDIFSVRVAGNVADVDEIGTLEYGTDHLGTPLIVVLGHTGCGAITAVVNHEHVTVNIDRLVDNIVPVVAKVKNEHPTAKPDRIIKDAVVANVWQAVEDILRHSSTIYEKVSTGRLKIVGAVYDIESGKVDFMGLHPEQAHIIASVKSRKRSHATTVEPLKSPIPKTVHHGHG